MKTTLFILCLIYLGAYFMPLDISPKPAYPVCTEESTEDYCDFEFKHYLNIP